MEKKDVYQVVTERITELLEKGEIPWHQSWNSARGFPKNLISRKEYRGINVFLLSSLGYQNPHFLTFKQANELGGYVRKGEKSCPVIFWKWLEVENEESEDVNTEGKSVSRVPFLRYYNVFNMAQTEGIPTDKIPPLKVTPNSFDPIESAQAIINAMPKKPLIQNTEARAYYRPSADTVNMPPAEAFQSPEDYYSTLFHELVHSTGHESRLNRKGVTEVAAFGSHAYSNEELCAEMGSAFLCGKAEIVERTIENSAAYIQNWLKALKNDNRFVIYAAAQAQKAADFILGKSFEDSEAETL